MLVQRLLARFCKEAHDKICDLMHGPLTGMRQLRLTTVKESVLKASESTGKLTGALTGTQQPQLQQPPATLVIASRESRLAMWQAEHVRAELALLYPQCRIEILGMTTRGDQILDRALSKVGGKGLFVKELEVAMAEGRADLAVHSLKDVPMDLPEGFELAAVLEREDARDAFVSNDYASLADLPAGAVVGTSSLRRQSLIAARHPHLVIKPLRGNLDTRLGKLDRGDYAAIILAAAGLKRLGLSGRIRALLEPDTSLPAAGQGAMAIEILAGRLDVDLRAVLAPLNHLASFHAVTAERTVSKAFGGSCQIPLAAFATIEAGPGPAHMLLRAMVATPDGKRVATAAASAVLDTPDAPERLGRRVADLLQLQDAHAILAECKAQAAAADA
jgi:hydroxymethylbilane synthase